MWLILQCRNLNKLVMAGYFVAFYFADRQSRVRNEQWTRALSAIYKITLYGYLTVSKEY